MSWRRWKAGRLLAVGAVLGAVAGVLFWGGLHTVIEATNSMSFCTSCHEMRDNVYVEYQKSAHYRNPSGVRATCADCHVPREWGPKMLRKVQATNELYHHLVGTVDTPEKFDARRRELAERVWKSMEASDSRECRNCHGWDAMDMHKQTARGREKMEEGRRLGKTCIECHHGVAHTLPKRDD